MNLALLIQNLRLKPVLAPGFVVLLSLVFLHTSAALKIKLTHGPVVGGVTSNSAKIFVRTNVAGQVQIAYGTRADGANARLSDSTETDAGADYTTQIPLQSLQPDTRYFLNVNVNGVRQLAVPTTFKTFPTDGANVPLNLVILTDFGSYTGDQPPMGPESPAFRTAASENPDFVFIGGDFDHRNPTTQAEKRQMFKDLYAVNNPNAKMDDFVNLILARFPIAHQWDDHDSFGNDTDRTAPGKEIAKQVFDEYVPAYPYGSGEGIYQKFTRANVDFFILDERMWRDPDKVKDSPSKSMLDGGRPDKPQLTWLEQGLKNSQAKWKIIFSSSSFNPTLGKIDSWRSFQYEHDALVSFIQKTQVHGVFVVSGDIHAGAMDDGSNSGLPEMVVPGVNLGYCFTVPQNGVGEWSNGVYGDPRRYFNDYPCNGYGVVLIKHNHARLRVKDMYGNVRLKMNLRSSILPD